MIRLLIVAILVISTVPLSAQGQEPKNAELKADAQQVVNIIRGDKAKIETYCQVVDLGDQLGRADQEQDSKESEALSQKIIELEKKLGPEFIALVESLGKANLTPKDGQEIVSMFDKLDDSCPH